MTKLTREQKWLILFWYFERYFEINELIVLLAFLFLKLLKTYWKTSQLNSNFAFVCNAKRFAMAFAMYFFFLSLSPVFLDGVAIGFCLYFPRLLLKTSLTLSRLFIKRTKKLGFEYFINCYLQNMWLTACLVL